jgi:hypothetical protein
VGRRFGVKFMEKKCLLFLPGIELRFICLPAHSIVVILTELIIIIVVIITSIFIVLFLQLAPIADVSKYKNNSLNLKLLLLLLLVVLFINIYN